MNEESHLFNLKNPSPYNKELLEILADENDYHIANPGERFYLINKGIKMCHLVRTGFINVWRSDEHKIIYNVPAPVIVGLFNALPSYEGVYCEPVIPSEIASITHEQALHQIEKNNKWEIFSKHAQIGIGKIMLYSQESNAPTAYEMIRYHLNELIQYPIEMREKTNAATYILNKTHLSRSAVMKVLAALKEGGFVEIEHGILKSVKKLPAKY